MEAQILHFRLGRHTQKNSHMIVQVDGVDNKEKALKLVNKKVTWVSKGGKHIIGRIANSHGNKGVVRVIFERGLPGQAINSKVKVE